MSLMTNCLLVQFGMFIDIIRAMYVVTFLLARSYSNTLLFNLNMRGKHERLSQNSGTARATAATYKDPIELRNATSIQSVQHTPRN
jgi:hypothetical protein